MFHYTFAGRFFGYNLVSATIRLHKTLRKKFKNFFNYLNSSYILPYELDNDTYSITYFPISKLNYNCNNNYNLPCPISCHDCPQFLSNCWQLKGHSVNLKELSTIKKSLKLPKFLKFWQLKFWQLKGHIGKMRGSSISLFLKIS